MDRDIISRKELLRTIRKGLKYYDIFKHCCNAYIRYEDIIKVIEELPPVNPQTQKPEHWEHIKDKFGRHLIICSCCKYTEPEYITFSRNYCPNCGCKMVDEQERSDKE